MESRIKALRDDMGITQQEMADRLTISRGNLASYETGRRNPSDAMVALICRVFGVNEGWLRTGEGEMYQPMTPDEELAAFFGDVLSTEDETFKRDFLRMLARLDDAGWDALARMADMMAKKEKN